jgi:hypothetical protein
MRTEAKVRNGSRAAGRIILDFATQASGGKLRTGIRNV